jgi:hypothetical protein
MLISQVMKVESDIIDCRNNMNFPSVVYFYLIRYKYKGEKENTGMIYVFKFAEVSELHTLSWSWAPLNCCLLVGHDL